MNGASLPFGPGGAATPDQTNPFLAMQAQMCGQQNPYANMLLAQLQAQAAVAYSQMPQSSSMMGMAAQHNPAFSQQQQPQSNGFNLSMIPGVNGFGDMLKAFTPVGSFPNDENLLAQALYESKGKSQTYKQALENLHGTNQHAANSWKDYYLEHMARIDEQVSKLAIAAKESTSASASKAASTKHSLKSRKAHSSRLAIPVASSSKYPRSSKTHDKPDTHKRRHRQRREMTPTSSREPSPDSSRPAARIRFRELMSIAGPHMEPEIPPPPSRSPTPPTRIVAGIHGNKYTEEDKMYFIKFMQWRLQQDPTLKKNELCEMLAEKAPHHTSISWASHWHSRHNFVDKIFYGAKGELPTESILESETDEASSDVTYEDELRSDTPEELEGADEDVAAIAMEIDSDEDVANMGAAGKLVTEADIRIMAKWILDRPDWQNMTTKDRWEPFSELYPQRSSKAWIEVYRHHASKIETLVAKQKRILEKSILTQVARPTWASNKKRKSHEEPFNREKRLKGDVI